MQVEELERLHEARAALKPVLHWYQSDEYPARPIAELIADIVADLQTDRRQALTLPRLIKAADRLSVCAQTTGGTAGRDEELVAAIDEYSKAAEIARTALERRGSE